MKTIKGWIVTMSGNREPAYSNEYCRLFVHRDDAVGKCTELQEFMGSPDFQVAEAVLIFESQE